MKINIIKIKTALCELKKEEKKVAIVRAKKKELFLFIINLIIITEEISSLIEGKFFCLLIY